MNLNESIDLISSLVKTIFDEGNFTGSIDKNTPLFGNESLLDSMSLIQLCLALEDKAGEMGFEFDWNSEKAMSNPDVIFRSIESLGNEFYTQFKNSSGK